MEHMKRGKNQLPEDLYISLDVNLQNYAVQACKKVKKEKKAKQVSMILMNPQNGEIYAMVNVPEYDLNDPFLCQQRKERQIVRNNRNISIRSGGIPV